MFTPQEVSEKTFPRTGFGNRGYEMATVDEFLDALTMDYTALYKDNATLKAKLKVLAEKIEEYRATEDAMRSTLLTAQKMASQLVQQAQVEKQQILDEAQEAALQQKANLDIELQQTQQKLALAQQELAEFITRSQELCANQAAFLQSLPEMDLADAQPKEDCATADTVRIIEQDILKGFAQPANEAAPVEEEEPAPAVEEEPVTEEPVTEESAPAAEEPAPVEESAAPQDTADKPFVADFNLDDLKFGRNYNSAN